MKLRSFFIILAISVFFILSLAGGSLYWILAQSPLNLLSGGVLREPTTAIFVPKQAPVMISLLVNPDRLEALAKLIAFPQNRRRSHQQFLTLEKQLLAKTGLDYSQQIQPWLGEEITLAVTSLDFDHNSSNGVKPGYLLAVKTKDSELAKEFIQASYSKDAIAGTSDLIFEPYKGVNLIYQKNRETPVNNNLSATAILNNVVLFANHPKILRDAINNVQVPDLNLKHAPIYQDALKTITEPHIGLLYANFPALSAWLGNLPIPELPEIKENITVAFSLKSAGLVAQTALIGVSEAEDHPPSLSEPVGALAYIPPDSILTAAGTDLNQLWTQIATGLATESPLQQVFNQAINSLQETLGLNLSEEIFPWVKGEFSLALVPNPNGDEPDGIFVAQKVPEVNLAEILEKLDELAQKQGYSVGKLPLLDTTVTAWTKLTAGKGNHNGSVAQLEAHVSGLYLETDDYVIFATSVAAMSQAISNPEMTLIRSEKLQQAIAGLSPENDGYLYIDWDQGEKLLEQKLPIVKVVELSIKPLLNNLRSLTISSQGSENGIRRGTVFFNLGVR
ncbi:MAG TPA: hypothetical protein DCF68_16420 [Cyanothece sp. UBA12306]|nr:hypothetical protein [Cyanothece sp. UBA12306]